MPYKDKQRQNDYVRAWREKRRREWIDAQGGVCAICEDYGPKLQIDHIDPLTKSCEVGSLWSRRVEVRHRELVKCQVLCPDCHSEKTKQENIDFAHSRSLSQYYFGVYIPPDCECRFCNEKRQLKLFR